MDKSNIGNKLKRLRERKGFTHEEVAYKCDISATEYNELESGKRYPSDTSLAILCEIYGITRMDLKRKTFIDHDKRKKIINYIQISLAVLLVFTYALPFEADIINMSGFQLIGSGSQYSEYVAVKIVLFILITQLIAHFLLYTSFKKFSNAFKMIFILGNTMSASLLHPFLNSYNNVPYTYAIFILLVALYIIVALIDIVLYPLEHDFLHDRRRVRGIFVLIANIVYFCLFLWVLSSTAFEGNYVMSIYEWIFFIIWASYHISYIVLRKRIFESRLISTITLALPPVVFLMFMIAYAGDINDFRYLGFLFIIMVMLSPSVIVNLDYLLDAVRSRLKINPKDIEQGE